MFLDLSGVHSPWILGRMLTPVDESPRLSNTSFVSIGFVWHHCFPEASLTLAGVGLHLMRLLSAQW